MHFNLNFWTSCDPKKSSLWACLLSSVLYILSFPIAFNSEAWPNIYITHIFTLTAFIPLLIFLDRISIKRFWGLGFLFHLISGAGTLYWIFISMRTYGELSIALSLFTVLLIVICRASILSLSFAALSYYRGAYRFLWGAAAFTLNEAILFVFPVGGFPWITPVYGLHSALWMIQLLDLIGIFGLSFVFFFYALHISHALSTVPTQPRKSKKIFVIIALATGCVYLYGAQKIAQWDQSQSDAGSLKLAYLQGNISQDLRMKRDAYSVIYQRYFDLLTSLQNKDIDLIVWPEAAIPHSVSADLSKFTFISLYGPKSDHLIGSITSKRENGNMHYYNSAFSVDSKGNIKNRYDKRHLVPFGEYVPRVLFLDRWVPSVAGSFKAATQATLLEVDKHPYVSLICYEVLFPWFAQQAAAQGSQFLLNITNDAWFNQSSGPYQHLRFAAYRAIETRKPLVRAANTGISAAYSPSGKIIDTLGFFKQGSKVVQIKPNQHQSFYVRYPHLSLWVIIALFIFLPLRYRNKNHA